MRHKEGTTPIEPGEAFLFKPGEPHQLTNTGPVDLVVYMIADNAIGECYHFPDSKKWSLGLPEQRFFLGEALGYYDGEE